jgi:hypothetical protein
MLALRAILYTSIGCHLLFSLPFASRFSLLPNSLEINVGHRRSGLVSTAVHYSQPFCVVITLKGLKDTG